METRHWQAVAPWVVLLALASAGSPFPFTPIDLGPSTTPSSAEAGVAPDPEGGAISRQGRRAVALQAGDAAGEAAMRRATFLRAHVASRMQHLEGHDADEVADAILAASGRAGVDPLLLLAMIEVESAFDPSARSSKEALGLMQVRPSTLWREARRSGLEGDDPHDPELNVAAGALYFRRLIAAFGPNDVALMAYNAGPNRILGHIRAGEIPVRYLEYPRRVRAAEARLRRALAVESAGVAVARRDPGPLERWAE